MPRVAPTHSSKGLASLSCGRTVSSTCTFQSSSMVGSPTVVRCTEDNVNKRELKTVRDAANRFMPGLKVVEVPESPNTVRIDIPLLKPSRMYSKMYFFIGRRKKDGRFRLLIPVESTGLLAVDNTLSRLQPLLKEYGLMLTQDAVIMEENISVPLDERIGNMTRAILVIDGIRNLWQIEYDRKEDSHGTESEETKPVSNNTNNRPSR